MGEYAKRISDGEQIKIGTCENMYYLRYDQRHLVEALPGNVDVSDRETLLALRFRFPWPQEDGTLPGGDFHREGYDRAVTVPGLKCPEGVEHYTLQFSNQAGYLVSLPCPEGRDAEWLRVANTDGTMTPVAIHRNGFSGAVQLSQQKLLADGRLVPVLRCGGCGTAWRSEDPAEIEAIAVAFRSEADQRERAGQYNGTGKQDRRWYDQVADRVLAGAGLTLSTVEG